jgi:hypothetical protein
MKYIIIFALGIMVGSFGTVKTLKYIQKGTNVAIEATAKGVEIAGKVVDSASPTVKETAKKVSEKAKETTKDLK